MACVGGRREVLCVRRGSGGGRLGEETGRKVMLRDWYVKNRKGRDGVQDVTPAERIERRE